MKKAVNRPPKAGTDIVGKGTEGNWLTILPEIDKSDAVVKELLAREHGHYAGAFLRPEGRDQVERSHILRQ